MLVIRTTALLTASLLLANPASADDRPAHFQGEPSPTLEAVHQGSGRGDPDKVRAQDQRVAATKSMVTLASASP